MSEDFPKVRALLKVSEEFSGLVAEAREEAGFAPGEIVMCRKCKCRNLGESKCGVTGGKVDHSVVYDQCRPAPWWCPLNRTVG